jgi:DNA-binding transcriptional LysR family regulator
MIIQWMQSFVAVADAGSFSIGASRIGLTQSTVSKQVQALEAHLSVRLFQRTTRSLGLTDEGSAFYESAKRALAAIDEAESAVGPKGDAQGLLHVTMPLTLAESRLVGIVARFLELHPRIQIDMTISDHALNLVADHIDVAIRVGRLVDSSLVCRKIGVARRVIVASPAYLDRAGRPANPADLVAHNCLQYSPTRCARLRLQVLALPSTRAGCSSMILPMPSSKKCCPDIRPCRCQYTPYCHRGAMLRHGRGSLSISSPICLRLIHYARLINAACARANRRVLQGGAARPRSRRHGRAG